MTRGMTIRELSNSFDHQGIMNKLCGESEVVIEVGDRLFRLTGGYTVAPMTGKGKHLDPGHICLKAEEVED